MQKMFISFGGIEKHKKSRFNKNNDIMINEFIFISKHNSYFFRKFFQIFQIAVKSYETDNPFPSHLETQKLISILVLNRESVPSLKQKSH